MMLSILNVGPAGCYGWRKRDYSEKITEPRPETAENCFSCDAEFALTGHRTHDHRAESANH